MKVRTLAMIGLGVAMIAGVLVMFSRETARHQTAMDEAAAHVAWRRGLAAMHEGEDPVAASRKAMREDEERRAGWGDLAWGAGVLIVVLGAAPLIARLRV